MSVIKAVFLDFYGTVVRDDRALIRRAVDEIFHTGNAAQSSEVAEFLWGQFRFGCAASFGERFMTQREIERLSLLRTAEHFKASLDVDSLCQSIFHYWRKPELFTDGHEFFRRVKIPVWIVSNIDSDDIRCAAEYHGLSPAGIFTSEVFAERKLVAHKPAAPGRKRLAFAARLCVLGGPRASVRPCLETKVVAS